MNDGRIEQILDLARWAPSGDNTQNWRFEITGDTSLVVHGFDTRDHCVYDLDGHPSQISLGALLETIAIAATAHRLRTNVERRPGVPDTTPTFDIRFSIDPDAEPDPLIPQITVRSVQRRSMKLRRLTPHEKRTLESALGSDYCVVWLEGVALKLRAARLMFANAKLRLTMPEAYRVHRDIIQWNARYSEDRVPDQALGVDPFTARLMRWVMRDWQRVEFFNRFLAGTLAPRLQMDLLPSLFCAAHFMIVSTRPPQGIDDYVAAGRVMQRFWLALSDLGLVMQPELTPLIFARYVREGRSFSATRGMQERAGRLSGQLARLVGETASLQGVFMGRIGAGPPAIARSTRCRLEALMVSDPR